MLFLFVGVADVAVVVAFVDDLVDVVGVGVLIVVTVVVVTVVVTAVVVAVDFNAQNNKNFLSENC